MFKINEFEINNLEDLKKVIEENQPRDSSLIIQPSNIMN